MVKRYKTGLKKHNSIPKLFSCYGIKFFDSRNFLAAYQNFLDDVSKKFLIAETF
jgi:hypothetical protein